MTGPDDTAPASPAAAPPNRWALGVGAATAVAAVVVESLTGAGGAAARTVAAGGFGLVGGLGGWLVA
ncbi:MAG TPA: hypothetical protein VD866_06140, partial [Urbifossiella sp.]|nr:hypothetical protein [Urbifossiella sp.]